MDTRHLEEFLALAHDLNWSSAAQKTYVARATLAEHMADLESELGCRLFRKKGRNLVLTPLGKRFVSDADELVQRVQRTVSEYQSLEGNFLLVKISATNLPWIESLLHRACRSLGATCERKTIEIATVPSAASNIRALEDGSNDLVVAGIKSWVPKPEAEASLDERELAGFFVRREPIHFYVTEGNDLFNKETIQAADLDGKTIIAPPDIYDGYIRDEVVERFSAAGAHVRLKSVPIESHFDYFGRNFDQGVGIVPETLVPRFGIDNRRECRTFDLIDFPFETDFYVLYRKDFLEDETARMLIDELKEAAREPDTR